MKLLDKLIDKTAQIKEEIEQQEQINALNYLYYIMQGATYRNMTMQEYFDKHYLRNCYYYSTYLILCLKSTDRLVRGEIHNGLKRKDSIPNYKHGWVEFEFNGKWWVYDDHYVYPISIEEYYKENAPYVIFEKFTQNELLEFVKTKFQDKISETKEGNKTILSTREISDVEHKIPLPFVDLEICDGEISKVSVDAEMKVHLC